MLYVCYKRQSIKYFTTRKIYCKVNHSSPYIMSPLLDSCQYWMDWMVDSCCGKVRDKSKLQARKQPRSPDARNAPSNLIDGNNILKRLEKERRIIKPPRSKNSKKNFKTHSHQAGQKKGRVMVRKVIVEGREFAVKDDSAADGEDEDEDSKKNLNKIVKRKTVYIPK